jgi:hypothetical protein
MTIDSMGIYEIARMLLARYRRDRGCQIVLGQKQVAKRTEALVSEVTQIAARIDALEASNG